MEIFWFLAGIFILKFAEYITGPVRVITHRYSEDTSTVVITDLKGEEVLKTSQYDIQLDGRPRFKPCVVGQRYGYTATQDYLQAPDYQISDRTAKKV